MIDGFASTVDILPTLCDLAGVELPEEMDGVSIADTLRGHGDALRNEVITDVMNKGFMIRAGHWKYVLNWKPSPAGKRDLDELYDLQNDPWETNNLAYRNEHLDRAASMREQIFTWLRETSHPYLDSIKGHADRAPSN